MSSEAEGRARVAIAAAAFIGHHEIRDCYGCNGVVAIENGTLLVQSLSIDPNTKRWHYHLERIPATREAARDWLNY